VTRDGKPLKSIPPAVKKEKAIAALAERLGELKKQASQVRWSLETSMCRGDELSAPNSRSCPTMPSSRRCSSGSC